MKKTFLLLASFFIGAASFAQSELSLGAEVGLPMGTFGQGYSVGFGASAKYGYGITDNSAITLSAGYMSFSFKSPASGSSGLIPVKAGYRYGFEGGFYVEPQLGVTMISTSGGGGSTSGFTYAANVGYMMSKVDLGIRYETVSAQGASWGFVGARVAYKLMDGMSSKK